MFDDCGLHQTKNQAARVETQNEKTAQKRLAADPTSNVRACMQARGSSQFWGSFTATPPTNFFRPLHAAELSRRWPRLVLLASCWTSPAAAGRMEEGPEFSHFRPDAGVESSSVGEAIGHVVPLEHEPSCEARPVAD